MDNNVVTYERNAQTRFFSCRSCHNHVLPGNDIRAVNLSASGDTVRALCLHPGQIRVAYHSYPMATMDIHCNVCNTYLGRRLLLHPVVGPTLSCRIEGGIYCIWTSCCIGMELG